VGPGAAYRLRCRAGFRLHAAPEDIFSDAVGWTTPLLKADEKMVVTFGSHVPDGTRERLAPQRRRADNDAEWREEIQNLVGSEKEMWVLLTWTDEANRAWAHILWLAGIPGASGFTEKKHWPLEEGAVRDSPPIIRSPRRTRSGHNRSST